MEFWNKANEYYENNKYQKAIKFFKKSVCYEKLIDKALAYYNIGVCYIKLKQYDKAIDSLKSAIEIESNSSSYFNLGYCYVQQNNFRQALINFNIAWTLNNDDVDCEKAINWTLDKIKSC